MLVDINFMLKRLVLFSVIIFQLLFSNIFTSKIFLNYILMPFVYQLELCLICGKIYKESAKCCRDIHFKLDGIRFWFIIDGNIDENVVTRFTNVFWQPSIPIGHWQALKLYSWSIIKNSWLWVKSSFYAHKMWHLNVCVFLYFKYEMNMRAKLLNKNFLWLFLNFVEKTGNSEVQFSTNNLSNLPLFYQNGSFCVFRKYRNFLLEQQAQFCKLFRWTKRLGDSKCPSGFVEVPRWNVGNW